MKERIEAIVHKAIEDGAIAGANVLAVRKGEVLYRGSMGYADVEKKIPLRAKNAAKALTRVK